MISLSLRIRVFNRVYMALLDVFSDIKVEWSAKHAMEF